MEIYLTSEDKARVYKINDGDIFTRVGKEKDYFFEYEDNNFYEVVEDGLDEFLQTKYKRTGLTMTGEEISKL